jgi:hypothetical protein
VVFHCHGWKTPIEQPPEASCRTVHCCSMSLHPLDWPGVGARAAIRTGWIGNPQPSTNGSAKDF